MRTIHAPTSTREGFTALPRRLLDAALCSDMGKRELRLWLLVARLTFGAQGREWAKLRPADLRVIGIGSNHAAAVLEGMLTRKLLVKNGPVSEYHLPAPEAAETETLLAHERQQRLRRLVARQISGSATSTRQNSAAVTPALYVPPKGNLSPPEHPKTGSEPFPKREQNSSPQGNASTLPAWAFSRSQRRFVKTVETPIDSLKTSKHTPPA